MLNIDTSIYDSDAEQNNPDWPGLVQQTTSIIHFKGCPLEAQEWAKSWLNIRLMSLEIYQKIDCFQGKVCFSLGFANYVSFLFFLR